MFASLHRVSRYAVPCSRILNFLPHSGRTRPVFHLAAKSYTNVILRTCHHRFPHRLSYPVVHHSIPSIDTVSAVKETTPLKTPPKQPKDYEAAFAALQSTYGFGGAPNIGTVPTPTARRNPPSPAHSPASAAVPPLDYGSTSVRRGSVSSTSSEVRKRLSRFWRW